MTKVLLLPYVFFALLAVTVGIFFDTTCKFDTKFIPGVEASWNNFPGNMSEVFYTFQDFYTDAQYGVDFGYYSKGRILQGEFFNSYTTYPMGLSPYFGHLFADRIHASWLSLGKPKPFRVFEFGGGTGVLARDIMLRVTQRYPNTLGKVMCYTIGERAKGLS